MALIRRDPWGLIPRRWQRDPWREIEEWFSEPFFRTVSRLERPSEKLWAPSVEMVEKKDNYLVTAELPGINKEEVKITLKDDILTIQGERKTEHEEKEANYYFCERSYGAFHRSIEMPSAVDEKKIKAEFKDGLLKIILPKTEAPPEKTKTIKID
jgi:HSP20 family protein